MIVANDAVGAAILMGVLAVVIVGTEVWARLGDPAPETTRKTVHLGSGLACLSFPLLVTSPWVVLGMAAAMTAFFRVTAELGLLSSVHGVERSSRGSEYYPLAIFLVFLLAHEDLAIYVSSVLILGVADAFAALIGSKYGRFRYTVQTDQKSVEGSAVFFAIAFVAILVPGWLAGDTVLLGVVLSAAIAAALLTGFEAIALDGSDNLFVPVAACVILQKQATDPVWMLVDQALVLAGLFVGLIALNRATRYVTERRQTAFNSGGAIVSAMFAYAVWTMGGVDWALPVMATFAGFVAAWAIAEQIRPTQKRVAVRTTYRALLVPLTLLILANSFQWYDMLYGPFVAACAAVLAFGVWNRLRHAKIPGAGVRRVVGAAATGTVAAVVVVAPPTFAQPEAPVASALFIVAALGPLAILNDCALERVDPPPRESMWPGPNFYSSAVAAALVVGVQALGWLGVWEPDLWNAVKMS